MTSGNRICLPVTVICDYCYFHSSRMAWFLALSCERSTPCQNSPGKLVSRRSLVKACSKILQKAQAPRDTSAVPTCIHVRVHACRAVCGRLLGQVGVEVSLGSVGNLFQSSLQLTRRPNEAGQGPLLWAHPAKPSKAVRAITQTSQLT